MSANAPVRFSRICQVFFSLCFLGVASACLSPSFFTFRAMPLEFIVLLDGCGSHGNSGRGGGYKPLAFRPRIKFARSEQFQQWFIASAPGEVTPMLRDWIPNVIDIKDIKIHEAHLPVSFVDRNCRKT